MCLSTIIQKDQLTPTFLVWRSLHGPILESADPVKNMEDNCSHSQNGEIEADWDSGPRYTVYHYRFTIDVLSIGHIIIGTLGVVLFIVEVSLSPLHLILHEWPHRRLILERGLCYSILILIEYLLIMG